jgi:hypothetical protein
MCNKPTYKELEQKINMLENEVLEYVRREKEFSKNQKLTEYLHMRRTISLIKINEELNKEIIEIKSAEDKKLKNVSEKLRDRIKELTCLYNISSLRAGENFSLDNILQAVVDFIPPAILDTEIVCARLIFDCHEYTTKNFIETKWKFSQEIKVHNESIGTLEVCYIKERPELAEKALIEETKKLINAISENIAQLVERDWAETEIIKCRNRIEGLIKQN